MSGAKFESFIEAVLVKEGYKVYRDQLYGSYGADMIADDGHIEYCVQTKRYSRNVGPAAIREALRGGQEHYDCDAIMVITNRDFTKGAIEMAKDGTTKLYNRKWLESILE